MALEAKEIRFGTYPVSRSYSSDKVYLSSLMVNMDGGTPDTQFVGPLPVGMATPLESPVPFAVAYPWATQINDDLYYVFLAENSSAAANRRIVMYEYTPSTQTFNWRGFIWMNMITNQTVRGFRMHQRSYITGTIAATGSSVAGDGTSWVTDRLAAGSRIGFGSTNPNDISTWYEVASIPSNVQITLSTPTPSLVPSGTAYVLEDWWALLATTAATAISGGLYVAKGLNPSIFSAAGTNVAFANTTNNIRATYFLSDHPVAASQQLTAVGGMGIGPWVSWQSQSVYFVNAGGSTSLMESNIHSNLTLVNGRDGGSFITKTGTITLNGTTSQANNGRVATLAHGPGSGSNSLYFVTTTRIYRAPLSSITSGSTTWAVDTMAEKPLGTATTFAVGSAFSAVEHMGSIDRLVVTSTGASGIRSYITSFTNDPAPSEHMLFSDIKQLNQSTSQGPKVPSINALPMSVWVEAGVAFVARVSTVAATNQLYALPLGADDVYADITGQYIITPKLLTTGCQRFRSVLVNAATRVGTGELALPTEPYYVYVRTAGIDDDSGSWTAVPASGDLGFLAGASEIQFKFTFHTIGITCIPARIHSLAVLYDVDANLLPELEWNLNDSDLANGTVGFTQSELFTGSVPNFTIDYYRSDTDALVLSQESTTGTNGIFEWFSGSVWTGSFVPNGIGPNEVGTRRRFVPTAGLPANVNVYPQIKQ